MKFAHLADCHIGAWREPKLRDANTKAFERAIDSCMDNNVDFIVIAGDLFNTSLPSIDGLKSVVSKLKALKDSNIPVYIIAGSHDFSPSGKTMLDVLENAGLVINVAKGEVVENRIKLNFTVDLKTGAKITGLLGKRGSLERSYYESLMREELEKEQGYKIFIFHSAITELKPKNLEKIESQPLSLLPKHFNYYAGGHPHFVFCNEEKDYGVIAYPGPLFPNNFKEVEELGNGGFYIVEDGKPEWQPVQVHNCFQIKIDCNHKNSGQIRDELIREIKNKEFNDTIVTIRLSGVMSAGKPSDIGLEDIFKMLYQKSAYFVMKNSSGLISNEFEEIKVQVDSMDEFEDSIIKEHLGQIHVKGLNPDKEEKVIKELITVLNAERLEGEKVFDFENRIKEDVKKIIGLHHKV